MKSMAFCPNTRRINPIISDTIITVPTSDNAIISGTEIYCGRFAPHADAVAKKLLALSNRLFIFSAPFNY